MVRSIGIVGTGIMGSGMADNYLKPGYKVFIWNRTPEKTTKLLEKGAVLCDSPKAVAQQADIIFEVTANDETSQTVWQAEDGILAGADRSKILITSATLSIDWTLRLSKKCQELGFTFFDIPLTGGRIAAETGSLILLVGGDETKLKTLRPDLKAISSKLFYFGEAASGMKYKLIVNSLQAAHTVAFGEAMRVAEQQNLDPNIVGQALCERPGGALTEIAWNAYKVDKAPLTFSVDWLTKDLEYSRQMSGKNELPILDDVLEVFKKARAAGHGDEDFTIVNKL